MDGSDKNFVDNSEAMIKPDKDAELNRILDQEFREYADYRKQFEDEWIECEDFYDSDQWKVAKQRPVKNFIFSTIESEVPILTDSRPSSDVVSYEDGLEGPESNEEKAKVLSQCTQWAYNQENFDIKLAQAVRESLKTGTGWHYTDYDPDSDNGEGNITIENLDWRQVYCDPAFGDINKGKSCHILFPSRKEELERKFPGKTIHDVSFESMLIGQLQSEGTSEKHWTPRHDPGEVVSKFAGEGFTVLHEIWKRDYTTVPVEEEETTLEIAEEAKQLINGENPDVHKYEDHTSHMEAHEGLKSEILEQRFWPLLAQISPEDYQEVLKDPTAIISLFPGPDGQPMVDINLVEEVALIFKIIDDHIESHAELQKINPKGEKPKYKNNFRLIMRVNHEILYDGEAPVDDGLIPLTPYYCYKEAGCVYGFGEIKNIIDAQKSYNEMDWAEYKGLKKVSNSGWIKDDTSNVKNDSLTNEEGIVITKKQGTEVKRLEPGEVSNQLEQRMFRDKQSIADISGVNEPTQGKRPTGITAAAAIRELREQSIGRIRLKTRMMESFSILRQGRLMASRIIKFWSTERKLRIWDDFGKIKYISFNPGSYRDFRYDVMIVPGSTAGMDKESIYAIYQTMFEKGGIDARTFFEVTDLPFKNKVLERMDMLDQQKMAIQQLSQENQELKTIILKIDQENKGNNNLKSLPRSQEIDQPLMGTGNP